jgi:hypothetical protein
MIALLLICFSKVLQRAAGDSCYLLESSYSASTNFFDAFIFETMDDPTHGYVDYVNESTASSMGLINYINDQVYIGVDYVNVVSDTARGRKSVRISSKAVLSEGTLLVLNLEHMPTTTGVGGMPEGCSIWPAFWTFGPSWPNDGEIDIIEYVNSDTTVTTTLHTNEGCDQASENTSLFTGSWSTSNGQTYDNCDVYASGNVGCSIIGPANTTGVAFDNNGVGGGVYAMLWTNYSIQVFYFPMNAIPSDISNGHPDPSSWGKPYARFELGVNCPSSHFLNQSIIFDTTFCGDWAGAVFPSTCSSTVSCDDYVQYNPSTFSQTYWLINYLDVYTLRSGAEVSCEDVSVDDVDDDAVSSNRRSDTNSLKPAEVGGIVVAAILAAGLAACVGVLFWRRKAPLKSLMQHVDDNDRTTTESKATIASTDSSSSIQLSSPQSA